MVTKIHYTLAHDALLQCGWYETENGLSHESPHGEVALRPGGAQAGWWRFHISGGAVPDVSAVDVLQTNKSIAAPMKFVALAEDSTVCRVDVPQDLNEPAGGGHLSIGEFALHDPMESWARVVTEQATGIPADFEPVRIPNDELLSEVNRLGWVGSVEEDQLNVHVAMQSVFRQVSIRQDADGAVVGTELANLTDYSEVSRDAALALAHEVNLRLPLVRISLSGEQQQIVEAEVHFGAALIPGAWLPTALEVVEAAIALAAREIDAVRDPRLAKLVLAASAAVTP